MPNLAPAAGAHASPAWPRARPRLPPPLSRSAARRAQEKGCEISELGLPAYRELSELFEQDLAQVWDYELAVERRDATGGTSARSVLEQVSRMEEFIAAELAPK